MARLEFNAESLQQMKDVENDVARACHKYQSRTEAAIVFFALLRVAAKLLRLYPTRVQTDILEAAIPFLKGEDRAMDEPSRFLLH